MIPISLQVWRENYFCPCVQVMPQFDLSLSKISYHLIVILSIKLDGMLGNDINFVFY